MAFSENQVNHFYVATNGAATTPTNPGDVVVSKTGDDVYFTCKTNTGIVRSDLININNIKYISFKDGNDDSQKTVLRAVEVKLADENLVLGQEYILRIVIRQYLGMSDSDVGFKYGAVLAVPGLKASGFYKKMAISLAKNFSREVTPLLKFYVKTASTQTEVTANTKEESLTGTYTSLVIEEVEQPWRLGVMQQVPVYFEVYPSTIRQEGAEVQWGEAKEIDSNKKINNGKKIADMEYFFMGERADMYRGINWPNNIPTDYMIKDYDAAYSILNIHYYYVGNNENPQKSEKDITIVSKDKTVLETIKTKVEGLINPQAVAASE